MQLITSCTVSVQLMIAHSRTGYATVSGPENCPNWVCLWDSWNGLTARGSIYKNRIENSSKRAQPVTRFPCCFTVIRPNA